MLLSNPVHLDRGPGAPNHYRSEILESTNAAECMSSVSRMAVHAVLSCSALGLQHVAAGAQGHMCGPHQATQHHTVMTGPLLQRSGNALNCSNASTTLSPESTDQNICILGFRYMPIFLLCSVLSTYLFTHCDHEMGLNINN